MKAAAAVRGQFVGTPTNDQGITTFRLPADFAQAGAATCYVGDPNKPATCVPSLDEFGTKTESARSGVGDYNPLYYFFVGLPSLVLRGDTGVIGMRAVAALMNGFFVGVLAFVAASLRRSAAAMAWISIACTPMVWYLGGIVNPNGVEVTGCAALAAVTWLVVHDPDRSRLRSRMALLAACGVVAGNARATSPLFVAIVLVCVLVTAPWQNVTALFRQRAVLVAAGVGVIGLAFAGAWTLLIGAPGGFIPASDPARDGTRVAFFHTLGLTNAYGEMMIGVLGWLDIHLPSLIVVGWTAAIGLVVGVALMTRRRRMLVGSVLLMAATVLAPAVIQAPQVHEFGYIWQGRYGLPLLAAMVIVAGLSAEHGGITQGAGRRLVPVVAGLSVLAQCFVFALAYKRYSVGLDHGWRAILQPGSWQAPFGFVAIIALFTCGALAFAAVAILASRRVGFDLSRSTAR